MKHNLATSRIVLGFQPSSRFTGEIDSMLVVSRPATFLVLLVLSPVLSAADTAPPRFERDIAPLIDRYCLRCHGADKPKGGVDLSRHRDDATIRKHLALWERVGENLRSGDMPPAGARKPTAAEMAVLERWLDAVVFKADCDGPLDPGKPTIRRLNRVEYYNTIRDLMGVEFKPAKDFPADDVGHGFDNIGDVLSLPPLLMEKYVAAAEQIVEAAWKLPEFRRRIQPPPFNRGALQGNLQKFASQAWRRPATEEEAQRLLRFVQLAREAGDSPDVGIRLALQAILVSPHFLYRIEQNPTNPEGWITPFELATRLSYFLWSSLPDDELMLLARENKLRQPGILEEQVRRMVQSPKSAALAENFAGQWLNIRSLASFSPDPKRFPTFNAALRRDMIRETEAFFLHVVRENRSVLDFLDADYTFLNARLARHYGISDVQGDELHKVSLKGTPRGGVLTQASVLAVTSNPTRTSPVKRGKWILENLLGTPPPPPAPDAGELPEGVELKGTLRQQMEQHRANPSCATCHQRMDPLGFGLENFDAIGAWRTQENGLAIDATGELPDGSKFAGPAELRKVLLTKKQLFVRCLTDKLLTYAIGRGTERSDRCFIEKIVKQAEKDDYRFTDLIIHLVKSDPFQKRRVERSAKR